jgi:7-cyano-7-deazaguanine reductase
MPNNLSDPSKLKSLGENSAFNFVEVDPNLLETFPNVYKGVEECGPGEEFQGFVNLIHAEKEFTSLCPKTGQPDFAGWRVKYIPRDLMVESKSWKLYMGSFRMTGEFHEACAARIMADLWKLLDPKYLEVYGDFTARGGIAIHPHLIKTGRA